MPYELDSIAQGQYILKMTSHASGRIFYSQRFEVMNGKVTRVSAYLNSTSEIMEDDTATYKNRTDMELNLAYTHDKWFNPNSIFTNGFLFGLGIHYWNAFSRHVGFLSGYGVTYRRNSVIKDTSFLAAASNYKKKREGFNYLDIHFDFKLRFSGGMQQKDFAKQKFLFELGAVYNFPLYFRYTERYDGNKMLQARGIHQFTDLRVFANAGYYPFVLFYECRLTDFVISGYPEVPRNTFGLRIFFDPDF
jgi:hypothetical protein